MIQLKPFAYNDFLCPECNSRRFRSNDVLIEGLHAASDNVCLDCGFEYLQLLPVGHTVDFPIAFGKMNSVIYDDKDAWVTKGLLKYFQAPRTESIVIKKEVFKTCNRVILLNALDFLYGHTLLKLLNCQHHLDEDAAFGLIVMIPRSFEWLVPDGCAEVWVVDLPLSQLHYRHAAIHEFVRSQIDRFEEVYLSRAYTHPDFSFVDIRRFTGVVPFNLKMFSRKPLQITFVLREDRFWVSHKMYHFAFMVLRRMGMEKAGLRLLALCQNTMTEKTIRIIRRSLPGVRFNVVGIGGTGAIEGATDRRTVHLTDEIERLWCRIYADSHLVIGIHGSNMLLPTAHAGGCIEILPEDRIPNLIQDVAVRQGDRRQLFLFRFLDEFVRPRLVAAHAVSILQGYDRFNQNMCCNQYTVVDDEDSSTA